MPKTLFKKRRFLRAFTLIELIAVVATVLILVLLVYSQIEQRGTARIRDAKRVTELNNIRTALQLYYMDKGEYPTSTQNEEWCSIEVATGNPGSCDNFLTKLNPYLAATPSDPLYGKGKEPDSNTLYSYQYISTSSGQGYKLHTDLEIREPYEIGSFLGAKIAYVRAVCGNGICETGETSASCPADCPAGSSYFYNNYIFDGGGVSVKLQGYESNKLPDGFMFSGTYAFNVNTPPDNDFFLAKLDDLGNQFWAKHYNYDLNDINRAGKPIYNHRTGGSVTGYILAGSAYNPSNYLKYGFIIKTDNSGFVTEAILAEGGSYSDWFNDVIQVFNASDEPDGFLAVGGYDENSTNNSYSLALRLDNNLNYSWKKKFARDSTGIAEAFEVEQTQDLGFIIRGREASPVYEYVIKLNSNGSTNWAQAVTNNPVANHGSRHITQLQDTTYLLSGDYVNGSNNQTYIIHINNSGVLLEKKVIVGANDDFMLSLDQFNDGDMLVAFNSNSFGGSVRYVNLMKVNSDWTVDWTRRLKYQEISEDWAKAYSLPDGSVVIGGSSSTANLAYLDSSGNCGTCDKIDNPVVVIDNESNVNWLNISSWYVTSDVSINREDIIGSVSTDSFDLIKTSICPQ